LNILAIDTADQVFSVALETAAGLLYTEIDSGSRHSELLMESVDWLCKKSGIKPAELELVACMKGPGSFTGLRIGFSAAKGMALALKIPLVTAPTLDCLAYPLSKWPGIVIPAMDAKKGCFFSALYRDGKRLTDYMDASPEELLKRLEKELEKVRLGPEEQIILTGCGAEMLSSRLAESLRSIHNVVYPDYRSGGAKALLKIIKCSILVIISDDINSGPIYLRKSDAEINMHS